MPGPLSGIRVADFTWVWAGPTCTMQLAHMGAEVIRMETTGRICTLRMLPPWPGGQPNPNRSGYFNQYNQGKRAVTLNIASDEGREIARKLVSTSDVAVENFAGGVSKKLGLGYDDLTKVKPDLVMISMSGFGQTGPEAGYVSYGPAQVPMSGLSQLTGYVGWQPDARRACPTATRTPACTPPSPSSPRSTTATAPARASTSTCRSGSRA